jgi:hypothetical protein
MKLRTLAAALLPPLLFPAQPASALWLSASELASHCDALLNDGEAAEATLCAAFIDGFLAGAAVAEESAARAAVGPTLPSGDSFSDRAVRTRVGSRLRRVVLPDLRYCVDVTMPRHAVIDRVAEYILRHGASVRAESGGEPRAQTLVHAALVAEFPCDDD